MEVTVGLTGEELVRAVRDYTRDHRVFDIPPKCSGIVIEWGNPSRGDDVAVRVIFEEVSD